MTNQRGRFARLRDPDLNHAFDAELLAFIEALDYVVITAVIDKLAHLERYRAWQYDPYHYCLAVILERYAMWLREKGARGDVMAESRGGREDRRLKDEFSRIYVAGTANLAHEDFVARFTSSQLKVKLKRENIAGLQLADLVAYPSYAAMRAIREGRQPPENFGARVATILEATKYRRSRAGLIDGYGRKWLP